MRRIHFDKISGDWVRIALLIISAIFIFAGYGVIFEYENSLLSALGFLIQIVLFSKIFWYKNHVQWNQKGIVIKTNLIKSKNISFEDIETIIAEQESIIIELLHKTDKKISLKDIHDDDKNRLIRILVEHSNAKYIDKRSNAQMLENSKLIK
jgi:hypothetical protein